MRTKSDIYPILRNSKIKTMKTKLHTIVLVLGIIWVASSCSTAEDREYYELKFYRYETEAQETRLDKYLASAYLPALHRAGVEKVGIFMLREEGNTVQNMIVILTPFPTMTACMELQDKLKNAYPVADIVSGCR